MKILTIMVLVFALGTIAMTGCAIVEVQVHQSAINGDKNNAPKSKPKISKSTFKIDTYSEKKAGISVKTPFGGFGGFGD